MKSHDLVSSFLLLLWGCHAFRTTITDYIASRLLFNVTMQLPSISSIGYDIVPGPFLLLLAIPALPLLLFAFGARPPKTDALPFNTDDVFQTGGLIAVVVIAAVVLGAYPDALSSATGWIQDGGADIWHMLPGTSKSRRAPPSLPRRTHPLLRYPNLSQSARSDVATCLLTLKRSSV